MSSDAENLGLVREMIPNAIGYAGGVGDDLPDILPSGDWEPYLPDFEAQSKLGLETMNCVQFSRLNVCETLANFFGRPLNLSDRFLYWASGCTERGNTFSRCDSGLKEHGAPPEMSWPWIEPLTREQYGEGPPADVRAEAKALLEAWDIGQLRFVPRTVEAMRDALKKTPLWFCNSGHAMMIYRIDDMIRVYDTYRDGMGAFPLSYLPQIVAAYNAPFTPKDDPKPMLKAPNNCLIAVVDGPGHRLMYADGRLYKDDAGKINMELEARNSKPCRESVCPHLGLGEYVPHRVTAPVPVVHCEMKDIEGIPIVNLKSEPVT